MRVKMAIGKDQLRDMFAATQPEGSQVRDILVRTKEGESDFEELVIVIDIPIAVPRETSKKSK